MRPSSELLTLRDIVTKKLRYQVPIYQRLYVWGTEQVRILMTDLLTACKRDGESLYYLGGTVVTPSTDGLGRDVLELIDGQQRFTTLWLIAMIWDTDGALAPFLRVEQGDQTLPRIDFAIRESVNRYFEEGLNDPERVQEDFHADAGGLQSLFHAQTIIRSFLDDPEHGVRRKEFNAFMLNQVKLVQTTVPAGTDLNKLFEVINNRGVQLQHHEILKARMLKVLDTKERGAYALLWDACASMDSYVERNLQTLSGVTLAPLFDNASSNCERLAEARRVLSFLNPQVGNERDSTPQSLQQILDGLFDQTEGARVQGYFKEEDEPVSLRSIFGFSVLLQHVLRVWLYDTSQYDLDRISDKELLGIFNVHFFEKSLVQADPRGCVKCLIELLWELRYLFDKYVIKWVNEGEEEVHLIRKLRLDESGASKCLRRDAEAESMREFSLLQSMLYHSQQITTQYWLTPLLAFMHRSEDATGSTFIPFLRHLDNHLLCSDDDRPLVQRTRGFMSNPWMSPQPLTHPLDKDLGVGFPHYWFYKLEYVLWHRFSDNEPSKQSSIALSQDPIITPEKLKCFRITARNSIEHVFPQNPPQGRALDVTERWLNAFGNLTLVSRSLNSEFGRKCYEEKRAKFNNYDSSRIDSLKAALIYANPHWTDVEVEAHQKEMIRILASYLQKDWKAELGNGASGFPAREDNCVVQEGEGGG